MEMQQPVMSQEDAIKMLESMSGEDIARLKRLSKVFRKPREGKHNLARSQRARARIANRKAKRKAK